MSTVDKRIKKQLLDGKGFGFIAIDDIPKNTVIINEQPSLIVKENVPKRLFCYFLIYDLFNNKSQLVEKFTSLAPSDLSAHDHVLKWIKDELSELKTYNNTVYSFIKKQFTQSDLALYIAKYTCNVFDFRDGSECILFTGTILNHSCLPNVTFGRKDNSMMFVTVRDIKKGEEVCDYYINLSLNINQRQKILREAYGFKCSCVRCINKSDNDKEIKKIDDIKFNMFGYRKDSFI